MKQSIFPFLMLASLSYSCQEGIDSKGTIEPPEAVIKKYQGHVDRNEFASAILLSTAEGAELIQEVAASLTAEELEISRLNTSFKSIDCDIDENIAICICGMEDEYEQYEAEFILVLEDNHWLVDAPEAGQDQEQINEIVDDVLMNLRN